jgi:hypothetical protein
VVHGVGCCWEELLIFANNVILLEFQVCMENEKLDEAAVHFKEAIEHFKTCGEQPDSRSVISLRDIW